MTSRVIAWRVEKKANFKVKNENSLWKWFIVRFYRPNANEEVKGKNIKAISYA